MKALAGARSWPPDRRLLPATLAASAVLHGALLTVVFVPQAPARLLDARAPLEVVLVNSRSPRRPLQADALAQTHLDGGGNTEADRTARSHLPAVADSADATEVSLPGRRVAEEQRLRQRLLTRPRGEATFDVRNEAPAPVDATREGVAEADSEARQLAIARLEARIARDWDQYQKMPRRKFIGARTEGVVYARYVDDWRQRIERVGTHNFPEEARRLGHYGHLLLTVSLRADGNVERVDVERSSGYPVLDRAAQRIVELAAPFPPLPPEVRRRYEVLSITRQWHFTRSEGLVTD